MDDSSATRSDRYANSGGGCLPRVRNLRLNARKLSLRTRKRGLGAQVTARCAFLEERDLGSKRFPLLRPGTRSAKQGRRRPLKGGREGARNRSRDKAVFGCAQVFTETARDVIRHAVTPRC